jgi:hypothetical protein
MEFTSCRPSGSLNFEVAPEFLEILCTPVLKCSNRLQFHLARHPKPSLHVLLD